MFLASPSSPFYIKCKFKQRLRYAQRLSLPLAFLVSPYYASSYACLGLVRAVERARRSKRELSDIAIGIQDRDPNRR